MKRKRAGLRLTQGQLAAILYPNDANAAETRKGDISKLENGKVANPNTTTITKIAKALGISTDEIDTLQRQAQMSPAQQLDHIATLPRDTLELLASRFEIQTPHRLTDAELQDMLTKKAEEYRSYRALIDGLDDRVAAIANLKGAAQDAAERLDFETVEELLSRVDTVETEIAADTKQARAANALLLGKVQQAFAILTAAADSFASIDPLEPSRRRGAYGEMLYDYGKRFAGEALQLAVQMWGKAANDVNPARDAALWAALQNNLGNALQTLGKLESGTARLEQAVEAFHKALTEWTQSKLPLKWATAQNNLGNALLALGERESGTARLEQAVEAYHKALTEWTQDELPLQWAGTQNNLGNALLALGERESGTARLDQAVEAYNNALTERTQDELPLDWARTQGNLGGVHLAYYDKEKDSARLDKAEAHVLAALKVFELAAPHYAGVAQGHLQLIAQRREGAG
jgi:tetratricopeptide (TPR) repeat protein